MMTGDFGMTGAAVARQVGIFTSKRDPDTFDTVKARSGKTSDEEVSSTNQSLLLEGQQIGALEKDDWDIVCSYEEIVFGRCIPEHKLRIIDELKNRGYANLLNGRKGSHQNPFPFRDLSTHDANLSAESAALSYGDTYLSRSRSTLSTTLSSLTPPGAAGAVP
jgi:hypothetical protein